MKILMFFAPEFWFRTHEKVLQEVPDCKIEKSVENSLVILYHSESDDVEKRNSILTKFIKNIKWLAGKFTTKTLVLHSFNHLSVSKAPADFTRQFISDARDRLTSSGYTVYETPFGYLNEWKIHVAGESLAKVFKDIQ